MTANRSAKHWVFDRDRGDKLPVGIGESNGCSDYGEDRFAHIGLVEGTLLFVSYAEHDLRQPHSSVSR